MSSSLESGSPPTRNVTGRVAKLSPPLFPPPPPAALPRAPVAGDEGDAGQVVAPRSEPMTQRARRRGRDHRPEGAAGEPRWIEGEPRAAVGELLAQQIAADARLGGRGEILWLDRRDLFEPARGEGQVGGPCRRPPPSAPLCPARP